MNKAARKLQGYVPRDASLLPAPVDIANRQELFAQAVVRLGNQMAAYREVYDVDPRILPQTIYSAACRLAAEPQVAARIYELKQQAAALALVDNAVRLQELRDIESADPTEIIGLLIRSCRHCHGPGHAYQWKNEDEYIKAVAEAIDMKRPLPSDAGGFDYNRALEPALDCPECLGRGEVDTWVADTRHLGRKARLLYKGAKVKADGSIEILLHDQMQARDQLNKILGLYKSEGSGNLVGTAAAAAAAATAATLKTVEALTPDQIERKYLELVS